MAQDLNIRAMPEVEGVTHKYVNAAGLRMHVAVAGPEDGEPVLLLHGWPQHWWLWHNVIPPLAEKYRVYAPDLADLVGPRLLASLRNTCVIGWPMTSSR